MRTKNVEARRTAGPPKTKRVFKAVGVSATFGVLSLLANLCLIPLIIGTVGAGPYGIWLVLTTLATYLYQADLGMGTGVVRFVALDRDSADSFPRITRIVSSSFAWMFAAGVVATPVIWFVGGALVNHASSDSGVADSDIEALRVLACLLILCLGLRVFPSVLQGLGFWALERTFQMVGLLVRVLGVVLVALTSGSIVHLAIVEVAALLSPSILSTLRAISLRQFRLAISSVSAAEIRTLLSFSSKSFAMGATGAAIIQAGVIVAGIVTSPSLVAYYNAILRAYMAVRQLLTWVIDPFLPVLTRQFAHRVEDSSLTVLRLMFVGLFAGAVGSIGLAIAAPLIVPAWLPGSGISATLVIALQVLLVGMVFNSGHIAANSAASAVGRPGLFLGLHFLWLVLSIALSFVLGERFGLLGISLGNAIPIIALEVFYVRRGNRALKVANSAWLRQVLGPVAGVVAVAGAASAVAYLLVLPMPVDNRVGLGVAVGAYGCAVLAMTFLARRSEFVSGVRSVMSLES